MKIGLQLPSFTWPGGAAGIGRMLADVARTVEEAGFYSLWVMDHFFQIEMVGPAEMDMMEGYSALSYCAAVTSTIKLGTMATGVIYRHPGILVKTATTLDVLCGGRSYFGIGAGWFEREANGLGVPFPSISERFERLEETLQIAKQMWSGTVGPYTGKHYHLEETLCVPLPLSRPYPPILIAGSGEKKTLRLVAQYGDACNLYGEPEVVAAKLAILRQHCDTLGRDYAAIEKTAIGHVPLDDTGKFSVAAVVARCRAFAQAGVDHVLFSFPGLKDARSLEVFGKEVIPAVADF